MATNIEQWIKDEEEAWSSQDVERILSFYTDDCIYEDLAVGRISHGREEVRAFVMDVFTAFPDFKVEKKSFFASGDHVCSESAMGGTYMGNIPGWPPANGKSFSVRVAHICELRAGKAMRVADYYDMGSMMRQLGLLPSPPGEIKMVTQPSGEVLDELDEKVAKYLAISMNCAQTSFVTLQEQFELDDGAVLKALTSFPGIALRGETCGAVTGSLMALGLVFGRERLDDQEGLFASLPSARMLCHRFEKELGSTMCGDILESELGKRYDLAEPAQVAEWQAAGGPDKCTAVVRKAVRIAAELIQGKT